MQTFKKYQLWKIHWKKPSIKFIYHWSKDEGYFLKNGEYIREDGLIDCYRNPEGYYLDVIKKNICHAISLVKSSVEVGNSKDNKCTECKTGYFKLKIILMEWIIAIKYAITIIVLIKIIIFIALEIVIVQRNIIN